MTQLSGTGTSTYVKCKPRIEPSQTTAIYYIFHYRYEAKTSVVLVETRCAGIFLLHNLTYLLGRTSSGTSTPNHHRRKPSYNHRVLPGLQVSNHYPTEPKP
jgi:hypothetical protein